MSFLNDDIVHALKNTIDSCINSATDRHGMCWNAGLPNSVKKCNVTFKDTDFGTNQKLIYDFLLVININLPSYLSYLLSCTVCEI